MQAFFLNRTVCTCANAGAVCNTKEKPYMLEGTHVALGAFASDVEMAD